MTTADDERLGTKKKELQEGDFSCGSFEQKVLAFDLYEKPFDFLMPDHRGKYRSLLGSLLSVITFTLVLGYAGYKFIDLIEYNDYKLMKIVQENAYDMREPFGSRDGFQLAAAITSYNSNTEPEEDPEIGTIKLIKKTWDVEDIDSGGSLQFKEIPLRPCTEYDFAGHDDSAFYPPKSTSILDLTIH